MINVNFYVEDESLQWTWVIEDGGKIPLCGDEVVEYYETFIVKKRTWVSPKNVVIRLMR